MLLNFSLSNYTSFDEQTTFSMEAGRARGKRDHLSVSRHARILKFSAMYGGNAAGKSNLVRAIDFARNVIVNDGKVPSRYASSYCRVQTENRDKPSTFEFEIQIDKKRYTYGFNIVLSVLSYEEEWLYENTTGENKLLFYRDFGDKTELNLPLKGDAENRVQLYFKDIRNDHETLFLHEINRKKDDLYEDVPEISFLRDIFIWFAEKLRVIYPSGFESRIPHIFSYNKGNLFSRLKAFGLDITDYRFERTNMEDVFGAVPPEIKKEIQDDISSALSGGKKTAEEMHPNAVHLFNGSNIFSFSVDEKGELCAQAAKLAHGKHGDYLLAEESDGTRRILELVEVLLTEDEDITYIVDEIDRSLHPLLSEILIDEYLSLIESRSVQLIITTHDTRFLSKNKLRRDEIWFAEKHTGTTEIFRFDQIKDVGDAGSLARGDVNIEAAYLRGRYGGVPNRMPAINEDSI